MPSGIEADAMFLYKGARFHAAVVLRSKQASLARSAGEKSTVWQAADSVWVGQRRIEEGGEELMLLGNF
ncbi:hypothetical protein CVT26_010238 [Gymnopilus dilepis]|uniref:Uncharacterized protein n=1 Tax=Gymnopilus dilepis TaxID=231916 RepID=A0A409Y1C7_9AGAR|nr:hypothetical protein CVT26_010238 [Gymnopilus dilepis]